MAVLHVTRQGAGVFRRGQRLIVLQEGTCLDRISTLHLEQVVLYGNVGLSAGARNLLLDKSVDTVFLSMAGRFRGRLVSSHGSNVELRREQFRQFDDPSFCLDLARRFVAGKLENCRVLVRRSQARRPQPRLEKVLHRLRADQRRLQQAGTLDQIRGSEGSGAAAYFSCMDLLILREGFPFRGRNRRPPRDRFNALLSFGYALLQGTVTVAIQTVGLDPYLGSLHACANRRPSLVLDLMEEFRPILVDASALAAVNRGQLVPDDFRVKPELLAELGEGESEEISRDDYPVLLAPQGLRKWVGVYEQALDRYVTYPRFGANLTYRQVCLEQARLLARHIRGEETYEPFKVR